MRSDKFVRAMANYGGFLGPQTVKTVLAQIPDDLKTQLVGRQLGLVMRAVNQAYHNGKAACGCEVIAGEAVWIDKLGHLYELDDIGKLPLAIGSRG